MEKNLSNDKSLEVNGAISRKNICCTIFSTKKDRKRGEPKTSELTVCNPNLRAELVHGEVEVRDSNVTEFLLSQDDETF